MPELKIDRDQFDWSQATITGEQLRHLPNPPIAADRDVYEEINGGDDVLIGSATVVQLDQHGETRFFTAPQHVTPGA